MTMTFSDIEEWGPDTQLFIFAHARSDFLILSPDSRCLAVWQRINTESH